MLAYVRKMFLQAMLEERKCYCFILSQLASVATVQLHYHDTVSIIDVVDYFYDHKIFSTCV